MEYLYEKLTAYGNSDYYAFHMPGHKRNMELMRARLPYNIDITEIDGFDDLHHAEGLLKELQENAARVFQAEETHYLVNGSTVGLLSAVMGCTERGGRILMARNCHKSVYNAVYMNELRPVYIYPEFSEETDLNGEIHVDQIKKLLEEYEDIQVVVIVSPTYEGVVSDIEAIAEIVHEYKIPLDCRRSAWCTFWISFIFSTKCEYTRCRCGDPQSSQDTSVFNSDSIASYKWEIC